MEVIRMVLVTLVLVSVGVLALALVAHWAARTERRSTGLPSRGSPGDRPGEFPIIRGTEDRAGDREPVGSRAARITRCGNGSPELDRRDDDTVRTWQHPRGLHEATATHQRPDQRHHATDGPSGGG
jgi:hypothetical protein